MATKAEIATSQGNAVSTGTQKMVGRTRHYFGPVDVTEMQIAYPGFFVAEAASNVCLETAVPDDIQLRLFVEYDGQSVQAMFGGNATGTIPAGGHVFCDPVTPDQFGLETFPAGAQFWLRFEKVAPVGGRHVYSGNRTITGETVMYGPTSAPEAVTGTGALTTTGYTTFGGYQLPIAIVGRTVSDGPSVGVIGASIEYGVGETTITDGDNGGGYIRRAFWSDHTPYLALNRSTESAALFLNNHAMRLPFLQYCDQVYCGHGGNDFSYGLQASNTTDRFAQIWELVKDNAMADCRVYQVLLSPKTNSTDDWATVENQTPRPGFENSGTWRDVVDGYSIDQVSTNANLDGVIDLRSVQYDETVTDVWRVDLGQPTADGVHPTSVIHAAMATEFRSQFDAING